MVGLSYRIQLNVSNLNLDRMISQSIHFWNRKYILFFFLFCFFSFFFNETNEGKLKTGECCSN